MKNVLAFLHTYWRLLVGCVLVLLFVGGCVNLFQSCTNSAERVVSKINSDFAESNVSKVDKLLSAVETLEKKDSIIQEKIKEIDSLRVELGGVTSDIDELYSFLSKRYDTKKPKR